MDFSPRQIQILFLLLESDKPINSNELAQALKTSRRTIFREMNHVDKELKKYHLTLERKGQQGFLLDGTEEDRQYLMDAIQNSDRFDPRNREKRQQILLKTLFQEDDLQKIYYYADLLQVSEGTISNDLEVIDRWLANYKVRLNRKAGYGVNLSYQEKDFRRALMGYEISYQDEIYESHTHREVIEKYCMEHGKDILESLTRDGRTAFLHYMTISVLRMISGHYVAEEGDRPEIHNESYYRFLKELLGTMSEQYGIRPGKEDLYQSYLFLSGCKRQQADHVTEKITLDGREIDLRVLVYEMINSYDSSLAYILKEDEDFIGGLMSHLGATLICLQEGRRVENQMLEKEREQYPDIFAKAQKASKRLEEILGYVIPEEETGLLAIHFGGALYRLRSVIPKKRVVRIAVVCSGGIGISAFMSTKLKHHFEDKIEVVTKREDNLADVDSDFLISPYPIKTDLDCLVADPLLGREDMEKITWKVDMYALQEKKETVRPISVPIGISQIRNILWEIDSVLDHFQFIRIPESVTFDEAERIIAGMVADRTESILPIYQAFALREAKSTQVIEDYGIVFLHAKTGEVKNSRFMVVLSEEEQFTDPYFKGANGIVVMLMAEEDQGINPSLSYISQAIFEEEEFLKDILAMREDKVREKIQILLETYLNDTLTMLYKKEK